MTSVDCVDWPWSTNGTEGGGVEEGGASMMPAYLSGYFDRRQGPSLSEGEEQGWGIS